MFSSVIQQGRDGAVVPRLAGITEDERHRPATCRSSTNKPTVRASGYCAFRDPAGNLILIDELR